MLSPHAYYTLTIQKKKAILLNELYATVNISLKQTKNRQILLAV